MATEASNWEQRDGALTLRSMREDSTCTLSLLGELDLANAATVSAELERLEGIGTAVTIDLSGLEFLDSTGIAILVAAHHRLGERLRVVPSRTDGVRRILALTGLDTALPFTRP